MHTVARGSWVYRYHPPVFRSSASRPVSAAMHALLPRLWYEQFSLSPLSRPSSSTSASIFVSIIWYIDRVIQLEGKDMVENSDVCANLNFLKNYSYSEEGSLLNCDRWRLWVRSIIDTMNVSYQFLSLELIFLEMMIYLNKLKKVKVKVQRFILFFLILICWQFE